MFEQLNVRVNYNNADYSKLLFPSSDITILKELARQVAEIAARPRMQENKVLWMEHNKLERTRPVFFCDPENGWNEIIPENKIQCTNSIARHWEMHLRKLIYWGDEMNDDYVVAPILMFPMYLRKHSGQ